MSPSLSEATIQTAWKPDYMLRDLQTGWQPVEISLALVAQRCRFTHLLRCHFGVVLIQVTPPPLPTGGDAPAATDTSAVNQA